MTSPRLILEDRLEDANNLTVKFLTNKDTDT